MNCTRGALRLASSQTLLARRASRPLGLVPSSSIQNVRLYAVDRQGKYLKKKKVSEKKKAAAAEAKEEEPEIEEAGDKALTATDEAKPMIKLTDLRHSNTKSIIPRSNDKQNLMLEDDAKQHEVRRLKDQLDLKKREILVKVKTLQDIADNEVVKEKVKFTSIEEAYQSMKFEFDGAMLDRNPDKVYNAIMSVRKYGYRLPKKAYDDAAVLFAEEQHIYKVKDVWDFMKNDEVFPDQVSFMNVVAIYCHLSQYEWAMKTFFAMCERLVPTVEAYEDAVDLFAKDTHIGNLRKMEQIFHTAHRFDVKHSPKSCAGFIRALCSSGYEGDGDRAVDILKYMKNKVIEPVPVEVSNYFVDHVKKYVIPQRQFIRAKKILRGCQHGGLPDEPFKDLWDVVDSKHFIKKISRADLAPPVEKMDLTLPVSTPGFRYGQ